MRNAITLDGAVAYIQTRQGETFTVDADQVDRLREFAWTWRTYWRTRADGSRVYYASARHKRGMMLLHRFVLQAQPGDVIDHINGDGRDNRRANLRKVTTSQNIRNQHGAVRAKSGIRNVYWSQQARRWRLTMKVNRKEVYVGMFATKEEAALAREDAMRRLGL